MLTGGSTPERAVAFAGAGQVVVALRRNGHPVGVVDVSTGALSSNDEERLLGGAVGHEPPGEEELTELRRREDLLALMRMAMLADADLLFPVLHGQQGEGGQLQALLELCGYRFVGSGAFGSALAMDKDVAKRLMRDAGIPVPAWATC